MSIIKLNTSKEDKEFIDGLMNEPVLDIELKDLDFAYKSRKKEFPVLEDISLQIKGSQLVSILGPNGVGKSTLIHCMNKILEPTGGAVIINDHDIKDISIKDLAKIMGYVPYSSVDNFPLTVTDTVLMGRQLSVVAKRLVVLFAACFEVLVGEIGETEHKGRKLCFCFFELFLVCLCVSRELLHFRKKLGGVLAFFFHLRYHL